MALLSFVCVEEPKYESVWEFSVRVEIYGFSRDIAIVPITMSVFGACSSIHVDWAGRLEESWWRSSAGLVFGRW